MANANRKFKLGKDNLIDTDKFQQDTNKKLCMFASILTVIVLIIVMILYASHK